MALFARGKSYVSICDGMIGIGMYLCEISFRLNINNIQFQLLSMECVPEKMYQKKSKHSEKMLNSNKNYQSDKIFWTWL